MAASLNAAKTVRVAGLISLISSDSATDFLELLKHLISLLF